MDNKNEVSNEKPKGNMLHNENRSDEENPVEDTNVKTDNTKQPEEDKQKNPTAVETD